MISRINTVNTKTDFGQKLKKPNPVATALNVNETNELYQKIIQNGYTLFKEVDIIVPGGGLTKGYSFVKSSYYKPKIRMLTSMITDKDFLALGTSSAHTYTGYGKDQRNTLICDVVNYTSGTNPQNFSRISEFASKDSRHGKHRNVGKEAYKSLEEYVLKNCPEVDSLLANPITSDSWDFHVKIGFDGIVGDYDSWATTNFITKKIK